MNILLGFLLLAAGPITYGIIIKEVGRENFDTETHGQMIKLAVMLSVPGVLYFAIGIFHLVKYKYVDKLNWKGLGVTALQLLPGLVISITAPTIDGFPAWLPMALGTATSLVIVRTMVGHAASSDERQQ